MEGFQSTAVFCATTNNDGQLVAYKLWKVSIHSKKFDCDSKT